MSRLVTRQDLRLLAHLPVFTLAAWVLPQQSWSASARFLAALPGPLAPFAIRSDEIPVAGRMAPVDRATQRVLRQFQYLREFRPGGWHPALTLENRQVLDTAAASGRGVILWIANTRCADLIAKKALHGAGLRLHHLSRPEHGGSRSRFGVRYLNAIPRRAEDRYLAERVGISAGTEFAATKRLKEILADGRAVSVTASSEGRRVRLCRVFGGVLPLATGAPALAHATGVMLVPVFCVQVPGRCPAFRVTIAEPISLAQDVPRKRAIDRAICRFAELHERHLADQSEQWRGFGHMIPADRQADAAEILNAASPTGALPQG